MTVQGKRVLITGSTQGIGYETAKAFVAAGAEVFIHCSTDLKKAQRVRHEIGAAHAVVADLSDLQQTCELFEKTGNVDILILNASVQYKENWMEISDEHFARQVNVNIRSTLKLMQLYYPGMKAQTYGRIITVGSVNQYRQHSELSMYAATKCAVMSLVKNVAKFAAPFGVTVNNVAPGAIRTPRNADVWEDPTRLEQVNQSIPIGRFGEPEEIAKAIFYLCGEGSDYITGEDIIIDGGMRL